LGNNAEDVVGFLKISPKYFMNNYSSLNNLNKYPDLLGPVKVGKAQLIIDKNISLPILYIWICVIVVMIIISIYKYYTKPAKKLLIDKEGIVTKDNNLIKFSDINKIQMSNSLRYVSYISYYFLIYSGNTKIYLNDTKTNRELVKAIIIQNKMKRKKIFSGLEWNKLNDYNVNKDDLKFNYIDFKNIIFGIGYHLTAITAMIIFMGSMGAYKYIVSVILFAIIILFFGLFGIIVKFIKSLIEASN